MTYTKHSSGSHLTLIATEMAGQNALFNGAKWACESLSCRPALVLPKIDIIKVEQSPTHIEAAIKALQSNGLVLAGIEPNGVLSNAIDICAVTLAANIPLAIAEQFVGSRPGSITAGDFVALISEGTRALFTAYDFIADDSVLQLVLEHLRHAASKAILIGDPAKRVKEFIDEIQLEWNDLESGPIHRPELTFRLACALTQVPELSRNLDTRERVANELIRKGLFAYNFDDTRKTVGTLSKVWNLNNQSLYLLPQEARKRGFPKSSTANNLFGFIEAAEKEERIYTSASGHRFDVLYITEL